MHNSYKPVWPPVQTPSKRLHCTHSTQTCTIRPPYETHSTWTVNNAQHNAFWTYIWSTKKFARVPRLMITMHWKVASLDIALHGQQRRVRVRRAVGCAGSASAFMRTQFAWTMRAQLSAFGDGEYEFRVVMSWVCCAIALPTCPPLGW